MSLETTLARISELNSALSPAPPAPPPASGGSFAGQLQGAMATQPTAASATAGAAAPMPVAGGNGASMVSIAQGEVGQAESPPGSNNSPRIAQYRSATAGNPGVGPWCAYFVSWVAKMAGKPIGDSGQGFGSVDAVWSWAQHAGRTMPSSARPRPGDLIVWDEHIGMVEGVRPDGSIQTIEGNSSDRVSRRVYAPGARPPVGYVRMS
jgi:hypothetical protein